MAENHTGDGLLRTEGFFKIIAKDAGITLESFKEVDMKSGVPFSVGDFASSSNVEKRLIGIYKFELIGVTDKGQQPTIEIALKAKGSPEETYMPLCNNCVKVSKIDKEEALLIHISQNFEHCSDLEIMAAQMAMKDEEFGRFLPKIYHTVHDVERKKWAVFMEYLNPNDLAISGGFDMLVWNRDAYKVALTELAKLHALYLGNLQYLEHHFGTILKHQPRRHLDTAKICQTQTKHALHRYSTFFTDEQRNIIANYFERLEDITAEIESFPMAFVHNDSHIGESDMMKKIIISAHIHLNIPIYIYT